jgi:hypothetical protein
MNHLTDPAQFGFTNHFNKSLLHSRIAMLNRQSSGKSRWRYAAMIGFMMICFLGQSFTEPTRPNGADTGSKYLLWHNRTLYGVVTTKTSDKDFAAISQEIGRFGVRFDIKGVKRSSKHEIVSANEVVFGDFGQYAFWQI